ncbi:hypothetical protein COT42_00450 [Candidatus Saganbacteria bacterium CG08_land_8_20_14_0_20_45_16]|uniref:Uncharacterized protein n=1 Tax=Candidatus Saganbacteria bacterium CG08_land_8_20_14_0_20_45_16 TaxID=2014293 RepID=A0A2H0Y1R2_UNCSA|nr:MAG: hypothetical protein COT42_00450 [Candidatus Saganbacteria bacterium CG08_land_8_20_14_0_20_45_16]
MTKAEKQITLVQVRTIMADDFKNFSKILGNVFCSKCGVTLFTAYRIFLHSSGDIILRGVCSKCGKKVVRVMETGENQAAAKRAEKIFNSKKSDGHKKAMTALEMAKRKLEKEMGFPGGAKELDAA